MARYDIGQGITSTGLTLSNDSMYISSGGTANSTTVNSYGYMRIYSGGVANSTTVNDGGWMHISSGGVANSTTVNDGSMSIFSGGVVNRTTVNDGSMNIFSGCVANSTTVNSGGSMFICSGGVANSTTVNFGGRMYISGGVANSTTVSFGGYMFIYSGGVANSTTVNFYGSMYIYSGDVANDTVNDGDMYIYSGGVANSTTVNSDGDMYIYSGGVANSTTVNSGGYMYLSSGGTASAIVENGGYVSVGEGADVTFASNTIEGLTISYCSMTVHENTIANSTTVNYGGYMFIYSGGVANSTTVNSGGYMYISRGGSVADLTLKSGGNLGGFIFAEDKYFSQINNGSAVISPNVVIVDDRMYISSGGVASCTTIDSDGGMYISSGGVASCTTIDSDGSMYIYSGGVANSTVLSGPYAAMYISSGGVANSTTVNSDGYMCIYSGGVANSTTVNLGYMYIEGGGVANSTTVNDSDMYISSGGVASCTTIDSDGSMYIYSGGVANSTTVNSGGYMYLSSGGTASAIVENGGYVSVGEGADVTFASNTIEGLTISYCSMTVHENTIANSTTVNYGGRMYIYSGGVTNSTTVNTGGSMYISSGGVTNSTTVNSGGSMYISSGGVTNSTTVNRYGSMCIGSGGVANSTTVNNEGYMYIYSGGVASNTTLSGSGCGIYLTSGAIHHGMLITPDAVADSSCVFVDYGAIIDFTVAGRSASDDFLINNLNGISYSAWNWTTECFTITVDADQQYGIYKLAQEAYALQASSISIGDGTVQYGKLVANGEALQYGDTTYSLHLNNAGELTLKVISKFITVDDTYIVSENEQVPIINVASGGIVYVLQKSHAEEVTVCAGGNLYVAMAGRAENITVDGGSVHVATGGIVSDVTIEADGKLFLYGGAILDGVINVNGTVILDDLTINNGTLNFMLNPDSADTPVINNMAYLSGGSYSVSVDGAGNGAYCLGRNADGFDDAITVQDQNGEIGSLRAGENISVNNTTYSLTRNDGNLMLDISTTGAPEKLNGSADGVSWEPLYGANDYLVKFSTNNFATALAVQTTSAAVDTFNLPASRWQIRASSQNWSAGVTIDGKKQQATPQVVISDADDVLDLFFARANGKWGESYAAEHQGYWQDWGGTCEKVALVGKNKLEDVFIGSADASILVLTDDANGDALFVDDIYSAFPDNIEAQARIAQIDEIRAGAGNDVVDLTSQLFEYVGDGVTVYGGVGNDTIWANSGNNILFGDAGNDRIVGGSDNDIIVGGIGNDSMHGGGGSDTFCFGENWGVDTVEQLDGGEVILWFETGSEDFWNAETMTYFDGTNRVTVDGVSADAVMLKFGEIETAIAGAFDSFASEKIFEGQNKAMLA